MTDETQTTRSFSRRGFVTGAAAVGVAIAASSFSGVAEASGRPIFDICNVPDDGHFPGIPGKSSTEKVFNYALTLEFLEADLYRQALNIASGKSIDTPLSADPTVYSLAVDPGGLSSLRAQQGFEYLVNFAAVEAAHRDFLLATIPALGGTPVSANPGGYKAPFGGTLIELIQLLRDVEETGVRAYLGAAQFIKVPDNIEAAAAIHSTEARHSAALNYILGWPVGPSRRRLDSQAVLVEHGDNNFEHWQTPEQILATVKPFLA